MKLILFSLLLFICFLANHSTWAGTRELSSIHDSYLQELKNIEKSEEVESNLLKAKMQIIAGRMTEALYFITKVVPKNKHEEITILRYQALIYFINGKFFDSWNILKRDEFNSSYYYKPICLMKILSMVFIEMFDKNLSQDLSRCSTNSIEESPTNMLWIKLIIAIKQKNENEMMSLLKKNSYNMIAEKEYLEIFLKIALYLNQIEPVKKFLERVPAEMLENPKIKEIMAMIYDRENNDAKVKENIQNLKSINALNLMGNQYIKNGENPLAIGKFIQALQVKKDSINATERLIPLLFLENKYSEAIKVLKSIDDTAKNKLQKMSLLAALYMYSNNWPSALKNLFLLRGQFPEGMPIEVRLIDNYVSLFSPEEVKDKNQLIKLNENKLIESIELACQEFDGISCYLAQQLLEKTFKYSQDYQIKTTPLENKYKQISPLKEQVFLDQKDIEELDSKDAEQTFLSH